MNEVKLIDSRDEQRSEQFVRDELFGGENVIRKFLTGVLAAV